MKTISTNSSDRLTPGLGYCSGCFMSPRTGTTLTEVLMSLMIMSIGVVSIATLFPLSASRAIHATHLTNSTILRNNAEAIIESNRDLVFDPDGDGVRNQGNYIVDPLGYREMEVMSALLPTTPPQPPAQHFFGNRVPPPASGFDSYPLPFRYLGSFDDPSLTLIQKAQHTELMRNLVTLPDQFIDIADDFPETVTSTSLTLSSQTSGADLLNTLVSNPSFTAPDLPFRLTLSDLTGRLSEIRGHEDLNANGVFDPGEVDFNGDGIAEAITLSGQTVSWTTPLTASLVSNGIGQVRFDAPLSGYSWLLTVKSQIPGIVNVEVAVFFKRAFSLDSEQVYLGDLRPFDPGPDGLPGVANFDDNFNTIDDDILEMGFPFTDDQPTNKLVLELDPALYLNSTAPAKPALRRGGYIFDTKNLTWNRIRSFEFEDLDGDDYDEFATVILEDNIDRYNTEDVDRDGALAARQDIIEDANNNGILDSGEDLNGNGQLDVFVIPSEDKDGDGNIDRGGIIVPHGIIKVFKLSSKNE